MLQLIAMEEYEVIEFKEKIASKFSPAGQASTIFPCLANVI
jgi:hypothetical protein